MNTNSGQLVHGVLYHYSEHLKTPKDTMCNRAAYGTHHAISSPLVSYASVSHAPVNLNCADYEHKQWPIVSGVLHHYSEHLKTPKGTMCSRAAYGTHHAISSPLSSFTSASHAPVNLHCADYEHKQWPIGT